MRRDEMYVRKEVTVVERKGRPGPFIYLMTRAKGPKKGEARAPKEWFSFSFEIWGVAHA
jgi:hypothetical protein